VNGSKVAIEGDVIYSLFPPAAYQWFSWCSAYYGGQGCYNGDLFSGLKRKAVQPQIHRLTITNINNTKPGSLYLAFVNGAGLGIHFISLISMD